MQELPSGEITVRYLDVYLKKDISKNDNYILNIKKNLKKKLELSPILYRDIFREMNSNFVKSTDNNDNLMYNDPFKFEMSNNLADKINKVGGIILCGIEKLIILHNTLKSKIKSNNNK